MIDNRGDFGMKILIYGVGRLGSFFKEFFSQLGYDVQGYDIIPEKRETEDIQNFDVIFVCTPMGEIKNALEHICSKAKPNVLLVDVSSVKKGVLELFGKSKLDYLSIHPLFGDETNVPLSHIILVKESKREEAKKILEEFENKGTFLTKMTVEEHDNEMAKMQGLTHFLLLLFAQVYEEKPFSIRVYNILSKLSARLLSENPQMYYLIQKSSEEYREEFVKKILELNEKFKEEKTFLEFFEEYRKKLKDYSFSGLVLELSKLTEKYESLPEIRATISLIDDIILSLLEKRVEFAKKVVKIKKELDEPIEVREIEKEKIRTLKNKTFLNPIYVNNIFTEIIELTKFEEYSMYGIKKTVALLGPKGSFSDEIALKLVGSRLPFKYCSSIKEVAKVIENGDADYGIVPIENSISGTVIPTTDVLMNYDIEVFGESKLEVELCLASLRNLELKDIKYVYSHPQAISQCVNFITNYLPHAEIKYTASTSDAIKLLDENCAVIVSEAAVDTYRLHLIRSRIQDYKERNVTRFYLIRKRTGNIDGNITAIFFTVENKPGALKRVVDIFYSKGFNLRKLESHPSKAIPQDYVFFTEVEANLCEEDIKELKNVTDFYKIVGKFNEIEKLQLTE